MLLEVKLGFDDKMYNSNKVRVVSNTQIFTSIQLGMVIL